MRLSLGHHVIARASVSDVTEVAQALAGQICQLIQAEQEAVGYVPPRSHAYRYFAPKPDLEKLKAAHRAILAKGQSWPVPVPEKAIRTPAALRVWGGGTSRQIKLVLDDDKSRNGAFNPWRRQLHITVSPRHIQQSYDENYEMILGVMIHELRHAVDWAYRSNLPAEQVIKTDSGEPIKREDGTVATFPSDRYQVDQHPARQQYFPESTLSWWRAYLANPTEQSSWAGNVANEFKEYPKNGQELNARLREIKRPMITDEGWAQAKASQPEIKDEVLRTMLPREAIIEVPVIDLLPENKKRPFIEMVTKALEQRFPNESGRAQAERERRDGPQPSNVQIMRENLANEKRVSNKTVELFAKMVWLKYFKTQGRGGAQFEGGENYRKYRSLKSFLAGEGTQSIVMHALNDYEIYQLTEKMPKNSRDEVPSLGRLIDRLKLSMGIEPTEWSNGERLPARAASARAGLGDRVAMPMPVELPEGWDVEIRARPNRIAVVLYKDYLTAEKKLTAYISANRHLVKMREGHSVPIWQVADSYTYVQGWGAYVYEQLLKTVSARGEYVSSDENVSDAAAAVWNKYFGRTDVEHTRHPRTVNKFFPFPEEGPDEGTARSEPSLQHAYRLKQASDGQLTERELAAMHMVQVHLSTNRPAYGLKKKYHGHAHSLGGYCSKAAEAVFEILGGHEAGYTLHSGKDEGGTHWWVQRGDVILDPTAEQYTSQGKSPPYPGQRKSPASLRNPKRVDRPSNDVAQLLSDLPDLPRKARLKL